MSEPQSMYAIPAMYGRRFKFMLSPSPEYRSAMTWEDTREVTAIRWDGTVDHWIEEEPTAIREGEK